MGYRHSYSACTGGFKRLIFIKHSPDYVRLRTAYIKERGEAIVMIRNGYQTGVTAGEESVVASGLNQVSKSIDKFAGIFLIIGEPHKITKCARSRHAPRATHVGESHWYPAPVKRTRYGNSDWHHRVKNQNRPRHDFGRQSGGRIHDRL